MILITPLVTLEDAKLQCNLKHETAFDQELASMIDQATGIIVEYIDHAAVTDLYTLATVPAPVHHAILLQTAWMFQHRGDEVDTNGVAPGVEAILKRTRKMAIS